MKKLLLLGAMGAAIFGAPTASAAEGDVVLQVNAANGKSYRGTGTQRFPWGTRWTSNEAPVVTVGMTNTSHGNRLNCGDNAEYITLQSDAARTIEYAITVEGNDYYVSSYSFNAFASAESMTLNGVALTASEEVPFNVENIAPTATSSLNVVFPAGTSTVQLRNFTITLSPLTAPVTFNFGDGLTATANVNIGEEIGNNSAAINTAAMNICPWGVSSSVVETPVTVSANGENVVNVTSVNWALPFEANKPYRLRLRPNNDTHAMVYTGTIGTVRDHAALAAELNPVSIWYFTPAAPVDNKLAFTLHTLAVEDAKGMHVNEKNSTTGIVITDNPTRFVPVKTNKTNEGANPDTDFCLRAEGGADWYVNEYLGNAGKNFAIYDSNSCLNDIGSVLRMVALTDADFEGNGWTEEGVFYGFDAEKKAAAQANATVENLRALFAEKRQLTYEDATIAFATYVSQTSLRNLLVASGLFNADNVMEAIGVSIDAEGVTDYTAELAAKKAAVDALDVHSLLVSYLNGKKVAFYGNSGDRFISNGNADGLMKRGSTTLTPVDVWEIAAVEGDNVSFTMKNLADAKYGNGNSLSDEAGVYKLVNGNVLNNGSFAIQSPANNNNYLNDNTGENPVRLFNAAGSGNGSSFFKIRLVTAEQEAEWKQAIAAKYAYEIGNLAGQFSTENPEIFAAEKAAADAFAAAEGFDYPTAASLYTSTPSCTLNPVAGGQLIRIKSIGGNRNYAITRNAEGNVSVGFTTEEAVFYYTPEGHLVAMANGLAASNNGGNAGMLTGATTAEQNGNIANHAREITFKAAEGSDVFGRYLMTFMNGTAERFVYNDGNSDAVNGGQGVTSSSNGYANYTYAVEPVMTLSVAVDGADGCGSIIAPVALTVPAVDGVQVYEAKTTGEDKLKFEPVEVGTTVAAGTPLIIYNETMAATTVDFAVDYSALTAPATVAEDGAATVENRFGGSHLALVHAEPAETHVTYVKSAEAFDNDNHEGTPVRFDRLAEGATVPAGAVTVKLVKDSDEAPEYTLLSLDGENPGTTMIEEITEGVNAAAEGAVYDLQGRRLTAPVKGINIINGKKVLVK